MRGLAAYITAGFLAALATCAIASVIPGEVVGAQTVGGGRSAVQWVDRAHKGNRLDLRNARGGERRQPMKAREKIISGCEPVFSPLAQSTRADNFAGRCVAQGRHEKRIFG